MHGMSVSDATGKLDATTTASAGVGPSSQASEPRFNGLSSATAPSSSSRLRFNGLVSDTAADGVASSRTASFAQGVNPGKGTQYKGMRSPSVGRAGSTSSQPGAA